MNQEISAFALEYRKIKLELDTPVYISKAFHPSQRENPPPIKEYRAIWDTGATGSVISSQVVKDLNLKFSGTTISTTTHGSEWGYTYSVNVGLPQKLVIPFLRVAEAKKISGIHGDVAMLIGMDIISNGDLQLTNHNGKTFFTFSIPSTGNFDYLKQTPVDVIKYPDMPPNSGPVEKVGRNDPCPCGSGLKYKKCHGK